MKGVIREGDSTSHGGNVTSASSVITVDGKKVAQVGDKCTCPIHGPGTISEGSASDLSFGQALAFEGCKTSCGATLISSTTQWMIEPNRKGAGPRTSASPSAGLASREPREEEASQGTHAFQASHKNAMAAEDAPSKHGAGLHQEGDKTPTGELEPLAPSGMVKLLMDGYLISASATASTKANEIVLGREAAGAFIQAVNEAVKAGERVHVNATYRTFEHQDSLFQSMPKGMASRAGSGNHEAGEALDIKVAKGDGPNFRRPIREDEITQAMQRAGFVWGPRGNHKAEAWHFETKKFSQSGREERMSGIKTAHGDGITGIYSMVPIHKIKLGEPRIQFVPLHKFLP